MMLPWSSPCGRPQAAPTLVAVKSIATSATSLVRRARTGLRGVPPGRIRMHFVLPRKSFLRLSPSKYQYILAACRPAELPSLLSQSSLSQLSWSLSSLLLLSV